MTKVLSLARKPDRRAKSPRQERARGLAFARDWRIRNRPIFDAIYGPETCACGSPKS
jgi:hypothetical protein